jgi:hypothetical protein
VNKLSFKGRRCTEAIVIESIEDFDKHDNYQYIGKVVGEDNWVVGYIFIDKPWYSQENCWTYYIKYQVSISSWGNQYWEEKIVEPDSIMPCTIRNMVKLNDLKDIDSIFVTSDYILKHFDDDILGTDIDEVIKKLNKINFIER